MPNEHSHLALANHNQDLLDRLVADIDRFPDWVATVAFYKALHVVEAVFACEKPTRHGVDHPNRDWILKTIRRYAYIYRHYRPLYQASMVARYMHDDKTDFTNYLSPAQVVDVLLKAKLHQVEKSAMKMLHHPDGLVTVLSRLNATSTDPPPPAPSSPT